jgi:hypothetical protein
MKNYIYGIILVIVFIVLARFSYLSQKEGFEWGDKTVTDFLKVQQTLNKNIIFEPEYIQKQASKEEVDYFLKNNMWPWSNEVRYLYEASVLNNPYVQTYPKDSIIDARKVYNQRAILDILSDQSKEGRFLSNGVQINEGNENELLENGTGDFGYNSGLIHKNRPVIKCHPETPNSNNYVLKKQKFVGYGGIMGEQQITTENVNVNDLETIIPGFTFLDKPCNPCSALAYNNNPQYDCPFSLNIKNNDNGISAIWEYLWSLNKNPITKKRVNTEYEINQEINANKFKQPPFNY